MQIRASWFPQSLITSRFGGYYFNFKVEWNALKSHAYAYDAWHLLNFITQKNINKFKKKNFITQKILINLRRKSN